MVEKLIPLAKALTFFGSKKHFFIIFLQIYLHPTSFTLRYIYSRCYRVYVTYIFTFIPTSFKAIPPKRRLKNWFNQLIDSVFAINRKCRNFLFHMLIQFVSQAEQHVSACDTVSKYVLQLILSLAEKGVLGHSF